MADSQSHNSILELIAREQERREKNRLVRPALQSFQKALDRQIRSDLAVYYAAFPNERKSILIDENDNNGFSRITRVQDEFSRYVGVFPTVRFAIGIGEMILACQFEPLKERNKTFRIVPTEDGAVELAECSIASLSEYLLSPICSTS